MDNISDYMYHDTLYRKFLKLMYHMNDTEIDEYIFASLYPSSLFSVNFSPDMIIK